MDRSRCSSLCFIAFLLFNMVFLSYQKSKEFFYAQGQKSNVISFSNNYQVTWGHDHVLYLNQGAEVQLMLDIYTGCGFASKLSYGSGFFNMSMKLPNNLYTAGLVIAFYLTSNTSKKNDKHDELDLEFLGHTQDKPYVLQTNVFANGQGNKEQRMSLWFDPSADFHSYKILWNEHQIVFYIDDVPIRVFKNNTRLGVPYPTKPMQVITSLWNGEGWATDQGRSKMNYSYAPFKTHFKGFEVNGCPTNEPTNIHDCYSSNYWWNKHKYWQLSSEEQSAYENFKKKHVYYDYCNDVGRHPNGTPPECNLNNSSKK